MFFPPYSTRVPNTVKNYVMKHADFDLRINNDNSTAVCFFHPITLESQIKLNTL